MNRRKVEAVNRMKISRNLLAVAGAMLLGGTAFSQGHYYSLLHNFAGKANDGASPQGSLTLSGTTLYGMTSAGGSQNLGTVFKINTDGTGCVVLHSFAGGTADGSNPYGSLTLSGTVLYGMTYGGGSYGLGTVFRVNTDGTGFVVLHSFAGGTADGSNPYGSLTLSGTVLYGMTYGGGSYGLGTVFRVNTDGTGFTVLHTFAGYSSDGANPYGSLTLSGSTLYGMTCIGGTFVSNIPNVGTVFKINTDGTGYLILHSFSQWEITDGANPHGSLTLSGSTLYGMTVNGGNPIYVPSMGMIFSQHTADTGFSAFFDFGQMHSFTPTVFSGTNPYGSLTLSGTVFYGMTSAGGGVLSNGPSQGIVFQINTTGPGTDGSGTALLHSFAGGTADGSSPYGDLTLSGSTLYGMTSGGGNGGLGVIFALTPNGPLITTQPSGQTVVAGNGATFTVAANAAATYQWQRQAAGSTTWTNLTDGANYSGTSTATLTVNPVTAAMNGDSFRCVVDNNYGEDTSAPASLTVTNAVAITGQPSTQSMTDGGSATFTVTATGVPPLTYQWQRQAAGSTTWTNLSDSANYSGTGTATLTVNPVTAAMSGDLFQCVISNAYGTATSSPVALVVPVPLTVSTLAGQGGHSGGNNGAGSSAQFSGPTDVAVDSAGNIYVADTNNNTIRKVTSAGMVSTVAGYTGVNGSIDGVGSAARFYYPAGVAVDGAGNIYVADTDNETIREITPAGVVTTVAGQAGVRGSTDGTGSVARFNGASGIVVDGSGNLYVADTLNHALRKITSSGIVSTFAGAAGVAGSVDGTGTAARFHGPQGLAIDGSGNLYVADANNSTIRKIVTSTGVVTTLAGLAGTSGAVDGPSSFARFYYPSAVTVDGTGDLYVADTENSTLREITPTGLVSTIAGKAGVGGSADGTGSAASFIYPTGITVDNTGNIYIADTHNDTIRLGYFPAAPTITTQPQSQTVTVGANVQFSVTASGKPTPTYQWYFNGTAISGATNSSLSLSSVQLANAGDYIVTVVNSLGSVTSSKATLTVNAASTGGSSSGGGGGGGGAMEPWFAVALVLLWGVQRTGQKKPDV